VQLRSTHLAVSPERESQLAVLLMARGSENAEPGRREWLLVAYAMAAFRIWYDEYLRGGMTEPAVRLGEMLATAENAMGSRPGGRTGRD
jgi:hypothetical protein